MGPPLWLQAKAPEDAWFITDLCFILASLPCSEPCTWCFLGKKLCIKISALGTQFGVLCAWWTLPELGENWVAYSCSCGCSLVRGIASRMCHGSWDGGRDDRSSLRLLSAASFVNAWAVPFTCQYFLIIHSSHDSWWSYWWWQQSGGIPAPSENWRRGERWRNWQVLLLALNTEWSRDAFTYMKITEEMGVRYLETTPERNKENEWYCQRVWSLRFLTSPAKQTCDQKKKFSCHCK